MSADDYAQWREEHPQADLAPVPADMVMASGSGLDPHITLKSARDELDRVAAAWAAKTTRDPALLRAEIAAILREKSRSPLGLDDLADDDRIAGGHRLDAVRGHLLEMAGDAPAARTSYLAAARRTTSLPERRYLESRAARLAAD